MRIVMMAQLTAGDIEQLVRRFDRVDAVQALVLIGSYARQEAGPYSDIDLLRFVRTGRKLSDDGTHFDEKKRLINISSVEPDAYEQWFSEPHQATLWIAGLRVARALIDREEFFAKGIQVRARNFIWSETIQSRANIEASRRMVGWSEEAHKGLEGLRCQQDPGRLLNAVHGLSWGLSEVLQIQRGVLVSSDNHVFHEVELALGDQQQMIELRRIAFGVGGAYTLSDRVLAGLKFYVVLAEQMEAVWQRDDIAIIEQTAEDIRRRMSEKNEEST